MDSFGRTALRLGVMALAAATTMAAGLDFNVCADINTSHIPKMVSIYQTNGLCHDFCIDDYAYGVTQGQACWCTDYAPDKSTVVDDDACNTPCPAFPEERCGGDKAFAYLLLNKVSPSGTKGGDEAPATTKTQENESEVTSSTQRFELTRSIIQTVTADGTIRTVTVAPTPSRTAGGGASEENNNPEGDGSSTSSGGLATGAVVGIVVGVLAALAALGVGLWFYIRRRKRLQAEAPYQEDPSVRGTSPGSNGPEMGGVPGSASISNSAGNRNSTLMIDPRMDPFRQGLYARNGSRETLDSLRDDHDYSRRIQHPLRATNPDPAAN